jgi:hypothetical protein
LTRNETWPYGSERTDAAPEAPTETIMADEPDAFHFDEMGGDWWETETAWFSFFVAERRLGGWLYTLVRPNIGTVAGGAWIWDDGASLPWEVRYSANYSALELPANADLRDVRLPTGVSIRVLEPTRSYALGYEDGDRLRLALRFDGVMSPRALRGGGSTFGRSRHFDQLGRVTGRLELAGETIAVDCIAMRDRTWGRRPENRPRRAAYVTGAAGAEDGFLAVTNPRAEGDLVAYGFLRRGGRTETLTSGERRVERDPRHGWVTRISLEAVDEAGRTLVAVGEPASRIVLDRHTFIDVNSLIRWELGGSVAWGEDQDMWPVHDWASFRRESPDHPR